MGRPAINTVFNPVADKDLFNRTAPSRQATAYDGKFRKNVIDGLKFFSSLDSEGAYSNAQAAALAGVLIPDVACLQPLEQATRAAERPRSR